MPTPPSLRHTSTATQYGSLTSSAAFVTSSSGTTATSKFALKPPRASTSTTRSASFFRPSLELNRPRIEGNSTGGFVSGRVFSSSSTTRGLFLSPPLSVKDGSVVGDGKEGNNNSNSSLFRGKNRAGFASSSAPLQAQPRPSIGTIFSGRSIRNATSSTDINGGYPLGGPLVRRSSEATESDERFGSVGGRKGRGTRTETHNDMGLTNSNSSISSSSVNGGTGSGDGGQGSGLRRKESTGSMIARRFHSVRRKATESNS